ncbi:MAG: hypothetical protein IGS49_02280 [Chlorogloeopsis fritschii C42_A2020_084]|uniref:hypothetical protein n=1 Tax=Chlorogloeopsis fritschii TaxID=1124 RepID=UPI0019DA3A4F|nr:hypothetical protein [Chlorogloeopsis fritschii]MBF2004320.1 hypothetical protein [Chlorogloeopsis fritschii C42_A2020_084]
MQLLPTLRNCVKVAMSADKKPSFLRIFSFVGLARYLTPEKITGGFLCDRAFGGVVNLGDRTIAAMRSHLNMNILNEEEYHLGEDEDEAKVVS